jgi:hypothetical protein
MNPAGNLTFLDSHAAGSYQKAFQARFQAAHPNYDVSTPENVEALAKEVMAAIAAIPF